MTTWDAIDTLTIDHAETHVDSSINGSHATGFTHLVDISIPASLRSGWDTDAEIVALMKGTSGDATLKTTSPFTAVWTLIINALKAAHPGKEIQIDGGIVVEVVDA